MAQTYPNKTTSLERHALKISKKTNTKGYERKARPSQATPPIIKSKTLRVSKQSSLKKLQRALNDELRCSVCYEVFSDPRTLTACLHSFCKECLHKMLSKRSKYIHCPLCRKKTAVPRRGVKGLPLNSVIRRLVDVLSSEGMTSARHRKRHPVSTHMIEQQAKAVKTAAYRLHSIVRTRERRICREMDALVKSYNRLETQRNLVYYNT